MGRYLDRLHEEFDTITEGINVIVDRAADDNRDVNDDETKVIEREESRREELSKAIEHYSSIEERGNKVAVLRGRVASAPTVTRAGPDPAPEFDWDKEFPNGIGDYAATVHRAMVNKDPAALALIERATAHQTTADNPGLIPRPILGPAINTIRTARPFVSSITNRPLPAGKFDRPVITQHVAVGKQTAEKALTESQKMTVGTLPVTAATYAGHLNISRQDIKWTSPAILSLVYDDFAAVYAGVTDADACAAFVASVLATVPIGTPTDPASVYGGVYTAAGNVLANANAFPDTMWVSPDVWGGLGSMFTTGGNPAFPGMSPTDFSGNPLGLKLVVDSNFPAGTSIVGVSRFAEWYEDLDGIMQVGEPDVLGQLVGYAGYAAFLNTAPQAFSKVTGVVAGE